MMSASVEIVFYWVWLIILVWENKPKLQETMVNYFMSRHYWLIEEYTRENSDSVKQHSKSYWLLLNLLLKLLGMTACSTVFPKRFNLLWWGLKIKKISHFQLVFKPVFFLLFSFVYSILHDCFLAGKTRYLFEIFSVTQFGKLCCNCI